MARVAGQVSLRAHGAHRPGELDRAVLGRPYQIYTIPQAKLAAYDSRSSVRSLLSEADRWVFPILIDGKGRFPLEVALQDGQWQVVRAGNAPMPEDMDEIARQLPALPEGEAREGGCEARYVRALSYYDFVLVCSPAGESVLLPRWAGLFGLPQRTPLEAGQWLAQLAQEARAVAAQPRADGGAARSQIDGGINQETGDSTQGNSASTAETANADLARASLAIALVVAPVSIVAVAGVLRRRHARLG